MHRPPATYQVDGTAIRTRRKELGLTRDTCAARAGISGPYLSQLENGTRRDMRPPTYKRLRRALQIRAEDQRLLTPNEESGEEENHARHEGAPHDPD